MAVEVGGLVEKVLHWLAREFDGAGRLVQDLEDTCSLRGSLAVHGGGMEWEGGPQKDPCSQSPQSPLCPWAVCTQVPVIPSLCPSSPGLPTPGTSLQVPREGGGVSTGGFP